MELRGDIAEARLYSTALGVYEVFANGTRAGTAELTPGWTSYGDTLYAQAMNVTTLLRDGVNNLEILLSDGWYRRASRCSRSAGVNFHLPPSRGAATVRDPALPEPNHED